MPTLGPENLQNMLNWVILVTHCKVDSVDLTHFLIKITVNILLFSAGLLFTWLPISTPAGPPARNIFSFIFCRESIFHPLFETQLRCCISVESSWSPSLIPPAQQVFVKSFLRWWWWRNWGSKGLVFSLEDLTGPWLVNCSLLCSIISLLAPQYNTLPCIQLLSHLSTSLYCEHLGGW